MIFSGEVLFRFTLFVHSSHKTSDPDPLTPIKMIFDVVPRRENKNNVAISYHLFVSRISFSQLDFQIDQLLLIGLKTYSPSQEKQINEYCDFMIDFIQSCGWTIEEYTVQLMQGKKLEKAN